MGRKLSAISSLLLWTMAAGLGLQVYAADDTSASGTNCSFQTDPSEFLSRQSRIRQDVFQRADRFNRLAATSFASGDISAALAQNQPAVSIPKRNFIDDEIFGQLASLKISSARLTTDEEFFRRIHLDLTGRIPAPDEIRAFLADTSPKKRDSLIDKLLYSSEFTDRWTMWMGDLLQNNATTGVFQNRGIFGRNSFYKYIWSSVITNKPLDKMAYEIVTAYGNNYCGDTDMSSPQCQNQDPQTVGAAGFSAFTRTPGGPLQDSYDTMLVKTATTFLGLGHYDCLGCHNGRGHLDAISLWGQNSTRIEAERMAAFFSRLRYTNYVVPIAPGTDPQSVQMLQGLDPFNQSWRIDDNPTGQYELNTNYGNRPNRVAVGTLKNLTPEYRSTGATPKSESWRYDFADNMLKDPMFARNFANRLWKQMFNLGLVDPVDTLDPARLDPNSPPEAPWSFQASHPVLLEKLANELTNRKYDLREFLRLLVQSSAYQLSSRYDGDWKLEYVPLYARHYPRRLEGEEIHDAIVKATGVFTKYTVQGWGDTVVWAMQLPEPVEPRSNGASANFMNAFLRGNRDTVPRNQAGSILQQLGLMNDPFVVNRAKVAASPTLMAISKIVGDEAALNEMFLLFLSRKPSGYERERGLAFLSKAGTPALRATAIEDLSWACVNKLDFLFSY